MDERIEDLLTAIGPAFRGLWVNVFLREDGTKESRWTVTYSYNKEYVETANHLTPIEALKFALMMVKKDLEMPGCYYCKKK